MTLRRAWLSYFTPRSIFGSNALALTINVHSALVVECRWKICGGPSPHAHVGHELLARSGAAEGISPGRLSSTLDGLGALRMRCHGHLGIGLRDFSRPNQPKHLRVAVGAEFGTHGAPRFSTP